MKFTFLTGLPFRIYTMREFTTKEDVLNTQKQEPSTQRRALKPKLWDIFYEQIII